MENFFSNDELINLEHEAVLEIEEKRKKVTVPKVQSMDSYIFQHYRTVMLAEANDKLASGEISRMIEMPIPPLFVVHAYCHKLSHISTFLGDIYPTIFQQQIRCICT